MIIAALVFLLHLGGGLAALAPAVERWRYRPALQATIALLAALLWLPVSSRLPLAWTTAGGVPELLPEVVWHIDQTGWFLSGFLLVMAAAAMLAAVLRDAPPATGVLLLLAGVILLLIWAGSPAALIMAGMLLALAVLLVLLRHQFVARVVKSRYAAALRERLAQPSGLARVVNKGWSAVRAALGALAGAAALLEGERGLLWLLVLAAALWLVGS